MRVMQINSTYGCGSTGLIVKDIDSALWNAGIESVVVYHSANSQPKIGYQVGDKFTSKLHAALARIYGAQGYGSIFSTMRIQRIISRQKPDVIHLHNLHSNYVHLNMLLSYLAKKEIPTILTLHDCWFFTGKCFHFLPSHCEKWKTSCGNCPRLKMDIPSILFDQTERVFRDKLSHFQKIPNLTVVGCSKWMTELAMHSPVFQGKKYVQIYNGVDQTVFYPRSESERETLKDEFGVKGNFVILGMANKWLIDENKRVFQEIVSKSEFTLCLVGCSEAQKEELHQYSNVVALGFISNRDELSKIYAMSDVFVNLTLVDTLPTVNMEALSCGTPVITYNSAGSPELVSEAITGFVVEQFDSKCLINRIQAIFNNAICRDACSKYARNYFEVDSQYKRYVRLYQEVVKK